MALLTALTAVACLLAAGPAAAAELEPWWSLDANLRPATLPEGGEGTLVLRASNLGNAATSAPATLTLELPEGASFVQKSGVPQLSFFAYPVGGGRVDLGPTGIEKKEKLCALAGRTLSCQTTSPVSHEALVPDLEPYEYLEIRARVSEEAAAPGSEYAAEVSGGGAAPLSLRKPLPLGSGEPPFGPEAYELRPEAQGGALDPRAGAHPYQLTATFDLNQGEEIVSSGNRQNADTVPPALPRNLAFQLPPGQIGNATALPRCSFAQFTEILIGGSANACPPETAIGVATVTIDEPANLKVVTVPVPLFNLEPAFGEPVRFGFEVDGSPVILDTSVRSGAPGTKAGDYGVTVSVSNITQLANFISSTTTFWGVPGDPSHDSSRGWSCIDGEQFAAGSELPPCQPQEQQGPPAFLTQPTDCQAPFATAVSGESWSSLGHPVQAFAGFAGANPLALSACNQVPFDPHIHSEPTSNAATSPTGLNFDIDFEDQGLTNPKSDARAQSQLKKAIVTLPQGFTANPSVAEGLKACTEAEYEAATLEANSGCTAESKVGEVTVQSPLVQPNQIVKGGIYVAKQGLNPNHNLLTLYVIVREPEIGVLIRQALKVTPDPVTGRLTTEVDNVPELPFSHFHLSFRQGQRSPLITPPACGPYTVKALLYPWSNPDAPVERTSSFQITAGPEGQGCPSGGVPPFHPNLEAGTQNNAAGTYSPFYTRISRKDSEQEITHFSIKLPPGVIGKLAGVAKCSDSAIAGAKAREHEGGGEEELQQPSCPAGSEVGHTLVGTGVGNVLAYAPGKLYLAGPYHGSQLSIVSVTAAKVGPFDLGTVVVREALKVNPETAQVSAEGAGSDPIPHIVDGIPVHLRDIRIYVDRPNFVLNPTSCARTSTASTVLGSGLDFTSEADDQPVTVTSPFQAADCASLGFKPKLALQVKGPAHRGGVPKFKATLTYPKGGAYANIAKSVLTLPFSEILEQGHIGTSCTRAQFNEGAGNGAGCPAASVYGRARAITPLLDEPLEGPVYLRSNGGEGGRKIPDLVAALHGQDINVNVVGFIDAVQKKGSERSRLRNTFAAVPDAPVEKFVLEMAGGKKGLLVNTTNICRGTHRAVSVFTGQNGKRYETEPKVVASGCGGKKGKGGKRHGHGR
ncbi:MAG TPA: hypothetical protein VFJ65_10505 [Solirubrobacterales bacterium]|nr:hypothetical protein [Solirubrobacterales bacterium]